jgi:hypothetical protein
LRHGRPPGRWLAEKSRVFDAFEAPSLSREPGSLRGRRERTFYWQGKIKKFAV